MATQEPMTMEEMLALPMTFGIKTAARALGLGERKAYELAAKGEFPVPLRRIGLEYTATRPDLFRYFGLDPALVAVPVAVAAPAESGPSEANAA
jgi:hypothetical protein